MSDEPRARRRPEGLDDAAFRLALFRDAHGGILAGLAPALVETLLRQQMAGQDMTYAARYPRARRDIVEVAGGAPIGRMVVDRTAEAITLVDIALLAAHRGRGLGTRLLCDLLDEARAAGVPVRLGVRLGHPARRLYERLGFVEIGVSETDAAMEWPPPPAAVPSS